MDVVLRPLEDAVLVDIPRLHAVCSRRTGVEQVNDLICAPWPEHSRVQSIVNTQIDLYLWAPLGWDTGAPFCHVSGLSPMAL